MIHVESVTERAATWCIQNVVAADRVAAGVTVTLDRDPVTRMTVSDLWLGWESHLKARET